VGEELADIFFRLFPSLMPCVAAIRVPRSGYEIVGLPIKGLDRKHLLSNYKVAIAVIRSMRLANKTIRNFRPDMVIGVGGYASGPTLRRAHSLGIPTLIQEQNSYAGVTNKLLSRGAHKICVAYPEMDKFFSPEKIVFTGKPLGVSSLFRLRAVRIACRLGSRRELGSPYY